MIRAASVLAVLVIAAVAAVVWLRDSSDTRGEASSAAPVATPSPTPAATPNVTATPDPEPTATATATPSPEPEAPPTPREVTLAFTGDLLSHGSVIDQAGAYGNAELAYDYRPMFAEVREQLAAADLAICHLETPLSADNTALSGFPVFNAPADLADAIAQVGYDGCSTASNHSLDRGGAGVDATLANLDRVGVGHAGMARTAEEAATPRLYEVDGVTIGHLSYTYGLNGVVPPADRPFIVDVTDPDAVLAEAAAAKAAGADFVVLSIQWGQEYQIAPTTTQRTLAEQFLTSPDIDLIAGSHAHVVQPIGEVAGEYVIYGLGNFLSNQSAECCVPNSQDGVIVEVVVSETGVGGGSFAATDVRFTPTWVDRSSFTIRPAASEGVPPESYERTVSAVTRLGAVDAGAAPLG